MLARFRERCRDRFLSPRPRAATPTRPVADAAGPRERLSWARYEPGWAEPRRSSTGHPAAVLSERLPVAGSPFDVAIAADGTAYLTRVRAAAVECLALTPFRDRKSTRLNSSHTVISYAVFCLKKKNADYGTRPLGPVGQQRV